MGTNTILWTVHDETPHRLQGNTRVALCLALKYYCDRGKLCSVVPEFVVLVSIANAIRIPIPLLPHRILPPKPTSFLFAGADALAPHLHHVADRGFVGKGFRLATLWDRGRVLGGEVVFREVVGNADLQDGHRTHSAALDRCRAVEIVFLDVGCSVTLRVKFVLVKRVVDGIGRWEPRLSEFHRHGRNVLTNDRDGCHTTRVWKAGSSGFLQNLGVLGTRGPGGSHGGRFGVQTRFHSTGIDGIDLEILRNIVLQKVVGIFPVLPGHARIGTGDTVDTGAFVHGTIEGFFLDRSGIARRERESRHATGSCGNGGGREIVFVDGSIRRGGPGVVFVGCLSAPGARYLVLYRIETGVSIIDSPFRAVVHE
mmetsp:Transcript_92536/g.188386  ORF Transcript_92536/g.188386 Transcript_92536/m.188386 type:complete len:368 (-) Transcript_92536:241-1344(-)